ncbi:hypothetical protein KL938_005372 [Ogataea parapolymorpha]|nr:hypothetical protein KL938_005372 [Ogataea parapolymorpha]
MAHKRRSTNTQTTTVPSEHTPLVAISRKQGKYLFDEIPLWQQDNHYIRSGYVRETNSFKGCFDSLFYLHNETVNIVTHLIPGFLLPLALLLASPWLVARNRLISSVPTWIMDVPVYDTTSKMDNFMFYLFFFGFVSCLTLSAAFHATKCHSHRIMKWGSSLDYRGPDRLWFMDVWFWGGLEPCGVGLRVIRRRGIYFGCYYICHADPRETFSRRFRFVGKLPSDFPRSCGIECILALQRADRII